MVYLQVDPDLKLAREDEDDVKIKALEYYAPPGQRCWVKITEVVPDPSGRGCRVHGSMAVVDQSSGADLDPTGKKGPLVDVIAAPQ